LRAEDALLGAREPLPVRRRALEGEAVVRVQLHAVEVGRVAVEGVVPEEAEVLVFLAGLEHADGRVEVAVDLLDPEVALEVGAELRVAEARLEVEADEVVEAGVEEHVAGVELELVLRAVRLERL